MQDLSNLVQEIYSSFEANKNYDFLALGVDVWNVIFEYLTMREEISMRMLSKKMNEFSKHNFLQRRVIPIFGRSVDESDPYMEITEGWYLFYEIYNISWTEFCNSDRRTVMNSESSFPLSGNVLVYHDRFSKQPFHGKNNITLSERISKTTNDFQSMQFIITSYDTIDSTPYNPFLYNTIVTKGIKERYTNRCPNLEAVLLFINNTNEIPNHIIDDVRFHLIIEKRLHPVRIRSRDYEKMLQLFQKFQV